MDWWIEVRRTAAVFLNQHGLLAACVALLLEEAGIPIPFAPGDLVMVLLGIRARRGVIPFWQIIVALEATTLVGSTLLYAGSRRAGRTVLYRYGRYLHATPERLARAEMWLQRRGALAIVVARLIPGCRIAAAVASGALCVPLRVFLPSMGLGALLSIAFFVLLGYFLGPPVLAVVERVRLPLDVLGSGLVLTALLVWVVRARRALHALRVRHVPHRPHIQHAMRSHRGRWLPHAGTPLPARAWPGRVLHPGRRARAGAAAGALATVAAILLMNMLVHVAGGLAFLVPGTLVAFTARSLPLEVARRAAPLLLLGALPVFVAVGVAWGAVYGAWVEHRLSLPDWAKGLVFALLPLAVALVIVLPVLGLGFPVFGAAPVAALGETVRHGAYGLLLGLTFPVFLSRRLGHADEETAPGARRTAEALDGSGHGNAGADRPFPRPVGAGAPPWPAMRGDPSRRGPVAHG